MPVERITEKLFEQAAEACIVYLQNIIEGMGHHLKKQAIKQAAVAGVQGF